MALFIRQTEDRTKLQERIAAELAERAKKKADEANAQPDGVDDARFMEGTKQTTSLAWVWVLIAIAFVGAFIWMVVQSGN